jgi:hypothetical protein
MKKKFWRKICLNKYQNLHLIHKMWSLAEGLIEAGIESQGIRDITIISAILKKK